MCCRSVFHLLSTEHMSCCPAGHGQLQHTSIYALMIKTYWYVQQRLSSEHSSSLSRCETCKVTKSVQLDCNHQM